MRQHLREKQRKQQQRLETAFHSSKRGSKPLQWRVKSDVARGSSRAASKADHEGGEGRLQDAGDSRSRLADRVELSSVGFSGGSGVKLAAMDVRRAREKIIALPKPQTILSAAKTDPFSTTPLSLEDEGHDLMDYYVTGISGKLFQFAPKGRDLFNPFRDVVFKSAMESPVAFQAAILALAASQRPRFYGLIDSHQSEFHKAKANRMLQEQVKAVRGNPTNDVILAMTGLAHLEDRWASFESAHKHMNAALRMVQKSSSLNDDESDYHAPMPGAQKYMHVIRYTLHMPADLLLTVSAQHPTRVTMLLSLLKAAHSLMVPDPRHREPSSSLPQTIFVPGTTWHTLLLRSAIIIPSTFKDNALFAVFLRAKNHVRAAAVLYLVVALVQCGRSPRSAEAVNHYLVTVDATFRRNELDRYPSLELLLWLLLEIDDDPAAMLPGSKIRPWVVGELLEVVKSLGDEGQIRMEETLLGILSMDIEGVGNGIERWERELTTGMRRFEVSIGR